jgi:hypothetical protein
MEKPAREKHTFLMCFRKILPIIQQWEILNIAGHQIFIAHSAQEKQPEAEISF